MAKERDFEPGDPGITTMQTTIPFKLPPPPLNAPRVRGASPESLVGTIRVSHGSARQATFNRFVLPIALLVVVGMLAGGYVAMHGERGPVVARPVPVVAPVAAPAPIVEPVTALVDVRIDSNPRGASVAVVDRGRTQLVGNTPISVALDPSRAYELVLAYPDRPTRIEHLDASATHQVMVALDPAPASHADHAARRAAKPSASLGEGTLMVSTKPPCEIVIDGRATGLTTPQKSITLAAGAHQLTLINRERGIQKTLGVQIDADEARKVIEDFSAGEP